MFKKTKTNFYESENLFLTYVGANNDLPEKQYYLQNQHIEFDLFDLCFLYIGHSGLFSLNENIGTNNVLPEKLYYLQK